MPADQATPPFWHYNLPENKLVFSSYHLSPRNANAYICALQRFAPAALEGYPSSLYTLARLIYERLETLPVKAVFTTSETLSADQRKLLGKVFQCEVFDYYGMAERVIAIHTCEAGNYHILPEYGIVELLKINADDSNSTYELIGTGLNNYAMPLIRYRLGDTVAFSDAECPCGRMYPMVKSVLGRSDDYIVTSRGTLVGRLDHIFKGAKNIVEAQIVQESLDTFEMKIVPEDDFCKEDGDFISGKLKERVGSDISVRINLVREIPRSDAGKLRATLSKLDDKNDNLLPNFETVNDNYEKCEV
jgi:phenylacetate-CoA ligase